MLNDRQIATLLWIGLFLVAVLAWPTGRKSLVEIARAFPQPQNLARKSDLGAGG